MTDDFAVAVQEGSTRVRLGSALFGMRPAATPASTVISGLREDRACRSGERQWISWDLGPTMRTTITTQRKSPNVLPARPGISATNPSARPARYQGDYESDGTVRTVPARPSYPIRDADLAGRRPVPATDDSNVQPRPINTPRQPPGQLRPDPYTVRPRRFDSAQELADKFKEGQPVIMNLEASDREVSRRLIDFASGLCYGLNGTMEKVATGCTCSSRFRRARAATTVASLDS